MAQTHAQSFCLRALLLYILFCRLADASQFRPGEAGPTPASSLIPRSDSEDLDDVPRSVTLTVSCVYPISGVYTRFQRTLFYTVIVVVFIFRFHKWLLAAGAAWLASYTVPAAIHAIILGAKGGSGVDIDVVALLVICVAGYGAIAIFAMYPSNHFRRWRSPILVAWSLLLTYAKVFAYGGVQKLQGSRLLLEIDLGDSFQDSNPGAIWQACAAACADVEFDPTIPFRTAADELVPDICEALVSLRKSRELKENVEGADSLAAISLTGLTALLVTFWLMFTSFTFNADFPPRVVRNWIYRRLTSSDPPRTRLTTPRYILCVAITFLSYAWEMLAILIFPLVAVDALAYFIYMKATRGRGVAGVWRLRIPEDKPASAPSAAKRCFAMVLGMMWYVWASVGYLAFPAIILWGVYMLERIANGLPEQETPLAVGQWSTWLGAVLAMLLAVYNWLKSGRGGVSNRPGDAGVLLNYVDVTGPQRSEEGMQDLVFRHPPEWLHRYPQLFNYYSMLLFEWADLKRWWRDPTTASWLEDPADLTRMRGITRHPWRWMIRDLLSDDEDVEEEFALLPLESLN